MSGLSSSLGDSIGWMLLRSLWQGTAVAMALALALRLLRRAPAQARYLAACVAMALMLVLPVTAIGRPKAIATVVPAPRARDSQLPRAEDPADLEFYIAPALRPWRTRIVSIFPAIVGLWMTGAGVLSLRLLGSWVLARQWVRRDTRPLVCPLIDRLKERMGIRRAVTLLESARVEVPMVSGWLHLTAEKAERHPRAVVRAGKAAGGSPYRSSETRADGEPYARNLEEFARLPGGARGCQQSRPRDRPYIPKNRAWFKSR